MWQNKFVHCYTVTKILEMLLGQNSYHWLYLLTEVNQWHHFVVFAVTVSQAQYGQAYTNIMEAITDHPT